MADKLRAKVYDNKFVGIDLALLNSPAWIALDRCSQALFIDLRVKLNGFNNGNINAAMSELKHRGWTSAGTLAKALRQLEAAGFIAKTRQTVGVEKGSKVCNLYRFTDLEVFAQGALSIPAIGKTCEFKNFKTLTDAKRVIAAASIPAKRPEKVGDKKKRSMQKSQRDAAEIAALGTFDAPKIAFAQKKQMQKSQRAEISESLQTQ